MDLKKVKELCRQHEMSIYDLEMACGLGRSSIYNWTRNTPSVDKVKKVADYFGVTVDSLINASETPFNIGEDIEVILKNRPDLKIMLSVAKECPPEQVLQAVKIIEALKK